MTPDIAALFETIIAEYVVLVLLFRKDLLFLLLVLVAIECITHPPTLYFYHAGVNIFLIEIVVVLVEACVYVLVCKWSWKQAVSTSLLANSASFSLGYFFRLHV